MAGGCVPTGSFGSVPSARTALRVRPVLRGHAHAHAGDGGSVPDQHRDHSSGGCRTAAVAVAGQRTIFPLANDVGSRRVALAFVALFITYHLPEVIGQRLPGRLDVVAVMFLLFFATAAVVALAIGEGPLRAYKLDAPRNWSGPPFLFVLAAGLKLAAVMLGLRSGVYSAASQPVVQAGSLVLGLVMTFVPSIAEDILTRGFWFRAAGARWSRRTFIVASSVIYVGNHVYRLGLGPAEWLMLFVFGVTYAAALVRFDTLWAAVGLHWGWNYGNTAADTLWGLTVLSPTGTRLLAIGSHLLMLIVVVALTHGRTRNAASRAAVGGVRPA